MSQTKSPEDIPATPTSDTTEGVGDFPMSASFMNLSLEEQEKQREEWRKELIEVEYEIQTMRHVLAAKTRKAQELKRKLGITAWKELQGDLTQGLKTVKESQTLHALEEKFEEVSQAIAANPVYQKTETAIKTTAEKTTSFFGGIGSNLTSKLGQMKNSEAFRSLEEKVGSAYTSVRSRVVTSRSSSISELDEAMKDIDSERPASADAPALTEKPAA